MDNYEFKVKSEEIKTLIARKKNKEAMEIADTVDWRKEKSSATLINISKLYRKNKKYEEARDILIIAYEKYPNRTRVVYYLCEVSLELEDIMAAKNYYSMYSEMAPSNTDRYILLYKLYGAIGVGMEERISVLEEYKRYEYSDPRWAYELAYMYHMVGQASKSVEECDELIRWFGDGKYVKKAMELKMLHEPLTPEQQLKYENKDVKKTIKKEVRKVKSRNEKKVNAIQGNVVSVNEEPEMDIQVRPVNVDKYATINLEKELGANIQEVLNAASNNPEIGDYTSQIISNIQNQSIEEIREIKAQVLPAQEVIEEPEEEIFLDNSTEEMDYIPNIKEVLNSNKTIGDIASGDYHINNIKPFPNSFREETGESTKNEILPEEEHVEELAVNEPSGEKSISEQILSDQPSANEVLEKHPLEEKIEEEDELLEDVKEKEEEDVTPDQEEQLSENAEITETETFYDDPDTIEIPISEIAEKNEEEISDTTRKHQTVKGFVFENNERPELTEPKVVQMSYASDIPKINKSEDPKIKTFSLDDTENKKKEQFEEILSQESDGQITMVVNEPSKEEKQITGQLSIQDILQEWERMKKKSEEEREKAVRQKVEEQTSELFSEFDASTKQGILADLNALAEENKRLEEESLQKKREKEEAQRENPASSKEKKVAAIKDKERIQKKAAIKSRGKRYRIGQRSMTPEERRTFGPFIQTRNTRDQIMQVLDGVTMASYTGNIIVTGELGMDTEKLAKTIIREIKETDSNLTGKVASISGKVMNTKNIDKTFFKFANGAVIIEKAGDLEPSTLENICKVLEKDRHGIVVVLQDSKINIAKIIDSNSKIKDYFNLRVDIEAMDNDTLVSYGKKYALEQEYDIDDLGVLALYTRVADMQTSEHSVTTQEVKEIVDEAISFANKKNLTHLMDILFSRRYNNDDMVILRENDFSH